MLKSSHSLIPFLILIWATVVSCGDSLPTPAKNLSALQQVILNILPQGQTWTPATPACSWSGVTCEGGIVVEIRWNNRLLGGFLGWDTLPQNLRIVDVSYNSLSGLASLTNLPSTLQSLIVNNNNFAGTPDLMSLPRKLAVLSLHENYCTGSPNLHSLLPTLQNVSLQRNLFSGTIALTNLTGGLNFLNLSYNFLGNTPILTQLRGAGLYRQPMLSTRVFDDFIYRTQ